jgi:hypothetical protein
VSEPERTMYASADAKRFFWVPNDEKLPDGPFVIRSLTGKRHSVDEAALKPFELEEERAKEITQQELARITQRAGNLLAGAASLMREAVKKPATPPLSPKAETNIANALGITEEQLRKDPKALLDSLGTVAQGFAATLKEAISSDPAERDRAKERMEILANLVRQETGAESTPIEQMPEKIREYLANPETAAKVGEATEKLKQVSADLDRWAEQQRKKD